MGSIRHEAGENPIEHIDELIDEQALKAGAEVVRTAFATFYGTNFRREYPALPFDQRVTPDQPEEHTELISV